MDNAQFTEIKAQQAQQEAHLTTLKEELKELKKDVKELVALANKSKGGFWAGMSIVGIISSAITWLTQYLTIKV